MPKHHAGDASNASADDSPAAKRIKRDVRAAPQASAAAAAADADDKKRDDQREDQTPEEARARLALAFGFVPQDGSLARVSDLCVGDTVIYTSTPAPATSGAGAGAATSAPVVARNAFVRSKTKDKILLDCYDNDTRSASASGSAGGPGFQRVCVLVSELESPSGPKFWRVNEPYDKEMLRCVRIKLRHPEWRLDDLGHWIKNDE